MEDAASSMQADQEDSSTWVDLMDGKIRYRTVKPGHGKGPEMDQDVLCSFSIALQSAPDSPLQRRDMVRYKIGESEAPPCVELALRYMKEGEEAEIEAEPAFAFGPEGCPALGEEQPVPGNAPVCLRLHLKALIEEDPAGKSWNDKIQEITWRKTNGNDYYRRKQLSKAARSYSKGLEVFGDDFEVPEHLQAEGRAEAASAAAASLAVDCASNLAAVHLELGDTIAARDAAKAALERKKDHPKALYRLARAHLGLHELDECQQALRRLQALEPSNVDAKRLAAQLRKARQEYEAKSRRVAKGFIAGSHRPDLVKPKKKPWEEETWSGWLRENVPWRCMLVAVCWFVVLVGLLAVIPNQYRRWVLIGFVMLLPLGLSVLTAVGPEGFRKEGAILAGQSDEPTLGDDLKKDGDKKKDQ